MSTERLSKLQKWVLRALYTLCGGEEDWFGVPVSDLKRLSQEGGEYIPAFSWPTNHWTMDAIFSQSIRNMESKGLICGIPSDEVDARFLFVGKKKGERYYIKKISLTEEGIEKAKGLLKIEK